MVAIDQRVSYGTDLLPTRTTKDSLLLFIWKYLVLHLLAIFYLMFCYVSALKPVRVPYANMEQMVFAKTVVTILAIAFVKLSLLPLYGLISEIKGEEFYRILSLRETVDSCSRLSLQSINRISTTSIGLLEILPSISKRQSSVHLTVSIVAAGILAAASSIPPSILGIGTYILEDDIQALRVGALSRSMMFPNGMPSETLLANTIQGGSIAWANMAMGINFSFNLPFNRRSGQFYLLPIPQTLTLTDTIRWISDVVEITPTCEWLQPHFPDSVPPNTESSSDVKLEIPTRDLEIVFQITDIYLSPDPNKTINGHDSDDIVFATFSPALVLEVQQSDSSAPLLASTVSSDGNELHNGAAAWLLRQCRPGTFPHLVPANISGEPINSSASNITILPYSGNRPVIELNGSDIKYTVYHASDGEIIDFSLLYCVPSTEVKTYEIFANGNGSLHLGNQVYPRQGNLDPAMVNATLSFIFTKFDEAGPPLPSKIPSGSLGDQLQFDMLFGTTYNITSDPSEVETGLALIPQSLANITHAYGQILQSASKALLSGSLGTEYVPTRRPKGIAVFTASLRLTIVSTVLYLLCSLVTIFFYFRPKVPQFTFTSIASSLPGSNIPGILLEGVEEDGTEIPMEDPPPSLRNAQVVWKEGRLTMKE
ncbi:hypothetical protein M422DRAFT_270466 [Sphaerobolus stellatus SS14]|uniref:Uncharacterized protein n=1 Tax=Sphaerobolus stellatus (strain SS14) TaxID=990650 RepID=A0A0C9US99_SPHS4|nr:hypothetical protein M422DRAFT_270466 [Sphaerobolus stellatus SS14]